MKINLTSKKTMEEIKDFWSKKAETEGLSYTASWTDKYCMELEVEEILNYLKDGDCILDVGCSNGYSTLKYVRRCKVTIKGLDYIEAMIENAKEALKKDRSLIGKAEFKVGNILNLDEPDNFYDKVIAVRVICNLSNANNQKKGILECARVIKTGGLLLISEPTMQSWDKLNKFRKEWQLEEMGMPDQNKYLDEKLILDTLSKNMYLVKIKNFSSTYFVMTRIIKPLFSYARGIENNIVDPELEWNRLASLLPSFGDYGIQKLFIFQKK